MRAVISPLVSCMVMIAAFPAAAQNIEHRKSLGIEVPVLVVYHRSLEGLVGTTSTNMGVFANGAGLNGQLALSNRTVLGLRLGFSRQTDAMDGVPSTARSQLSLLPRFEYYAAPDRPVRPHIGIEVGLSRSTAKGGPAMTEWSFGPTAGIAYFPSDNWSLDFNVSPFYSVGSESFGGGSAGLSGYGAILRVNLASWFGGDATENGSVPSAVTSSAPLVAAPQATAAPAPVPVATASGNAQSPLAAAAVGVTTNSSATSPTEPSASDVQPVEGARTTLELREGRRLTLVMMPASKVKFILVKSPLDEALKTCGTVEIHSPKQMSALAVRHKQLSTASGEVSTLSAELPVETLKSLLSALSVGKGRATTDYFIGVCGQNWQVNSNERSQLKGFLESL